MVKAVLWYQTSISHSRPQKNAGNAGILLEENPQGLKKQNKQSSSLQKVFLDPDLTGSESKELPV